MKGKTLGGFVSLALLCVDYEDQWSIHFLLISYRRSTNPINPTPIVDETSYILLNKWGKYY
jgi:hypothetical protein